jgi:hypothetical protein
MSRRANAARRLASILSHASGVPVRVQYYQQSRVYGVRWEGGPTIAEMQKFAGDHAGQVPALNITTLVWLRTAPPSSPYGR